MTLVNNQISALQESVYAARSTGVYGGSIPLEARVKSLEHNNSTLSANSFTGILSSSDNSLQQALQKIDQWGAKTANHAVLFGQGSGKQLVSVLPSSNGQLLVGSTNADPTFITPTAGNGLILTSNATTLQYALAAPVSVANGGTGMTTLSTYALLAGGTTSTGVMQSLPSGNSGDILMSNGASALPVWTAPLVQTAMVTLTNAQVRNLGSVPVAIVGAPGAGKVISVINCFVKLNCPTGSSFTGKGDLSLGYAAVAGQEVIKRAFINSSLTDSKNQLSRVYPDSYTGDLYTNSVNLPILLYRSILNKEKDSKEKDFKESLDALGGNIRNDNTITVIISYQVLTI